MSNTVSKFRAVMRARGFEISFGDAAQILVDAGICERINDGVALVTEAAAIRATANFTCSHGVPGGCAVCAAHIA